MNALPRRVLFRLATGLSALVLSACASVPAPTAASPSAYWEGRLGLQIHSQPPEQFFAGFSLHGNADNGELELSTPLGNTLAVLHWAPGQAWLRQNDETRHYPSLEALVEAATGTAIPVSALFDWLHGKNVAVPGWQADLSRLEQGRLNATRQQPAPQAELRLILLQP